MKSSIENRVVTNIHVGKRHGLNGMGSILEITMSSFGMKICCQILERITFEIRGEKREIRI